jgi:hypothetical protein
VKLLLVPFNSGNQGAEANYKKRNEEYSDSVLLPRQYYEPFLYYAKETQGEPPSIIIGLKFLTTNDNGSNGSNNNNNNNPNRILMIPKGDELLFRLSSKMSVERSLYLLLVLPNESIVTRTTNKVRLFLR